jgi:hypothetical protein
VRRRSIHRWINEWQIYWVVDLISLSTCCYSITFRSSCISITSAFCVKKVMLHASVLESKCSSSVPVVNRNKMKKVCSGVDSFLRHSCTHSWYQCWYSNSFRRFFTDFLSRRSRTKNYISCDTTVAARSFDSIWDDFLIYFGVEIPVIFKILLCPNKHLSLCHFFGKVEDFIRKKYASYEIQTQ